MRILVLLLKTFLILGLVGAAAFLVVREVLLEQGVSTVIKAARPLISETVKQQYWRQCQEFLAADDQTVAAQSVELAFTSDTEFQLQVICPQYTLDPVVIQKFSLPQYVRKVPGSAGFVAESTAYSTLSLEVWGRRRSVSLDSLKLVTSFAPVQQVSTTVPVTSCAGFGYTCCQADSETGVGEQVETVSDCPKSCFSACQARPVVLSFNTQPFYEAKNRVLKAKANQAITFSYVVDPGAWPLAEVIVDFGDGQKSVQSEAAATVSHSYACLQAVCQFQATVTAVDTQSITSAKSGIQQVTVQVSR